MSQLEIDYVQECLNSQWIGFGKKVEEFEKEFSSRLGFDDMVMVDSGSNGLYLATYLLDLPPGSEVILPALTWISCANALVLNGLKPVFADVDMKTMCIDPNSVASLFSHRTSAIMTVHFAGFPSDVDVLNSFGVPVIEDAAHAVFSSRNGVPCGSVGEIGVFSFDAVKNLAVGEGGGLVSRNPKIVARARELRYCGIRKSGFESAVSKDSPKKSKWWEYDLTDPFIKMLPTNISASIGLAQLQRKEKLQSRRKQIWDYYQRELSTIGDLILPIDSSGDDTHSYFTFVIRSEKRDELASFLLQSQIYTTLRYQPLDEYPAFGHDPLRGEKLRNTAIINRTALSIPLHPRLTDTEAEEIVHSIKTFYTRNRN